MSLGTRLINTYPGRDGSRDGLQQTENQMKCVSFAMQLNENLNAEQAALTNKVYNHLSFKENLSNEEDTTTLDKILKSVKSSNL